MKQRTWLQRAYLWLLCALGIASAAAIMAQLWQQTPPPLWLTLLVAGAFFVANVAVVRLETAVPDSPIFINTAPGPLIFGVLVLGPIGLPVLLLTDALARWARLRVHQPLGYIFNAVDFTIAYLCLLAISPPLQRALVEPSVTSAGWLLATLFLYPFLSLLFGSLLTAIGTSKSFIETARTLYLPIVWADCVALALGMLAVALFASAPTLLLLVGVPFVLTYQALRAIAGWLAASEALRSANAALEARVAERTAALTVEPAHVAICVRDNGVGIAPEHLARIGERFYRVAHGLERPEGSGIGLACSTRIIALSGGSLCIQSDGLGQGTAVTVRLPATAESPAVIAARDTSFISSTQYQPA